MFKGMLNTLTPPRFRRRRENAEHEKKTDDFEGVLAPIPTTEAHAPPAMDGCVHSATLSQMDATASPMTVWVVPLERESRNAKDAQPILNMLACSLLKDTAHQLLNAAKIALRAELGANTFGEQYESLLLLYNRDPRAVQKGDNKYGYLPLLRPDDLEQLQLQGNNPIVRIDDSDDPYFLLLTKRASPAEITRNFGALAIAAPGEDEIIRYVLDVLCKRPEGKRESIIVNARTLLVENATTRFVGREQMVERCNALLSNRWERYQNGKLEKSQHPVGTFGGPSGIGKTRGLQEATHVVDDFAKRHPDIPWVAHVLITYNSGHGPFTDHQFPTHASAFALRVLYFAFSAYMPHELKYFGDFVTKLKQKFGGYDQLGVLTMGTVLQTITDTMDAAFNIESSKQNPGIICLGVDETNLLLADTRKGDDYGARLKSIFIGLGDFVTRAQPFFLFPMVAGTAVVPLQFTAKLSGVVCDFFPMQLLSMDDIFRIMHALETGNEQSIWNGWQTCRKFRKALLEYGAYPKALSKLLSECEKCRRNDMDWEEISMSAIGRGLDSLFELSLEGALTSPEDFSYQLLEDNVLQTPVVRSSVVPGSQWTYGDLDSARYILLVRDSSDKLRVSVIWKIFEHLLTAGRGHPVVAALLRVWEKLPQDHAATIEWQGFEDFCVHFGAAREMFLFNRADRNGQTCVTLEEFYSGGLMSDVTKRITIELSRKVYIATSEHRFPESLEKYGPELDVNTGNDSHSKVAWDDPRYRFKNAGGARYDAFGVREIKGVQPPLVENTRKLIKIADQMKNYVKTEVTRQKLCEEARKTTEAHEKLKALLEKASGQQDMQSPPAIDHVLVVFATRAHKSISPDTVPEGCIVLAGDNMRKYFGDVLCERAFAALSAQHVHVNVGTTEEFHTVPKLGAALTKRIVDARSDRLFESREDFMKRTRIRDPASLKWLQFPTFPREDPESQESNNHANSTTASSIDGDNKHVHQWRGFENLGNTCYIGAVLQALLSLPGLREAIIEQSWDDLGVTQSCGRELCKLASQMSSTSVLSPKNFKSALETYFPQFQDPGQHDAEEFCSSLLGQLDVEIHMLDELRRGSTLTIEKARDNRSKQETTLSDTIRLFQLRVQETLECSVCGQHRDHDTYSLGLQIPVLEDSLTGLVTRHFRSELIGGGEAVDCEQCEKRINHTKHFAVVSAPRYLIIQLKRFDNAGKKLTAALNICEALPLATFNTENQQVGATTYELKAIVRHIGHNTSSGHYICDVRGTSDWTRHNDNSAAQLHHGAVLNDDESTSYLFFYEMKDWENEGEVDDSA